MLGAALHQEEVQGDLKGAIAAYQKVLAAPRREPQDRGGSAGPDGTVLREAGRCGVAQGLRTGGAGVRRSEGSRGDGAGYGLGRTQLVASLRVRPGAGLDAIPRCDLDGTVSPDGRYLYIYRLGQTAILSCTKLPPVADRRLTDTVQAKKGQVSMFSRRDSSDLQRRQTDRLQLVLTNATERYELNCGSPTSSAIPQFRRLYDNEDVNWISPDDWSPDGKWLAVEIERKDKTTTDRFGLRSRTARCAC